MTAQTAIPTLRYGPELRDDILGSFSGRLQPVSLPLTYRAGLLAVAALMVILPLVYLALIGLAGYGIYYYFTHVPFPTEVRGRGAIVVWGLYLSPVFIGPLLIVFMLKPLFAKPAQAGALYSLSPKKEPLLFTFVERLCQVVGAPVPKRIDVDCQVNASAGLRRGFSSLFSSDLVLTIGLPLAAGTSLAQLAGVLAHELGHFAQGAGMRLTYVVRRINAWFSRVVYERDSLDQWLDESAKGSEHLLGMAILNLARLMVWLTRRVLWGLMWIGHGFSCFLLRQMEFDADRYEAGLVGDRTFESTVRELGLLSVAHQQALGGLEESFSEGRLADSLPALAVLQRRQLGREVQVAIDGHIKTGKTGLFDTHPADGDRIASVRRFAATPVFASDLPATALFRDFDELSRAVSRAFYRSLLGDEVLGAQSLVQARQIADQQEGSVAERVALQRYFGAAVNALRPLRPAKLEQPPAGAEALAAAREAVARVQLEHARRLERHEQAYERLVGAIQARALVTAGFEIQPKDFDLPRGDAETVEEGFSRARGRFAATAKQLAPLEKTFTERWTTAVHLLVRSPELTSRVPEARALVAEARAHVRTLQIFAGLFATMTEIRTLRPVIGVLAAALEQVGGSREAVLDPRQARLQELLTRVSKALAGMPYPFDHADPEITLESYVVTSPPDFGGLEALFPMSQTALERFHEIYRRLWGRLAWIAEQVETAAGLEPLPTPEA